MLVVVVVVVVVGMSSGCPKKRNDRKCNRKPTTPSRHRGRLPPPARDQAITLVDFITVFGTTHANHALAVVDLLYMVTLHGSVRLSPEIKKGLTSKSYITTPTNKNQKLPTTIDDDDNNPPPPACVRALLVCSFVRLSWRQNQNNQK